MNTPSAVTAGPPTMKPPAMGVCHTSLPVVASTAHTTPFQSPKYATPPTTAGVPLTPTKPSSSQLFVRVATFAAVIDVPITLVRVLDGSCMYPAHSSPDESACEPEAEAEFPEPLDGAPPTGPLSLHAAMASTITTTHRIHRAPTIRRIRSHT